MSTLLDWEPPLAPRDMRNAGVLAATDLRHPVLRPFDAVAANFGQVMFDRAWQIDPRRRGAWSRATPTAATALAERTPASRQAGRILLFTSDVDRRWNDFPLHPAFVPFAQEVARYLGARAAGRLDLPRGGRARRRAARGQVSCSRRGRRGGTGPGGERRPA